MGRAGVSVSRDKALDAGLSAAAKRVPHPAEVIVGVCAVAFCPLGLDPDRGPDHFYAVSLRNGPEFVGPGIVRSAGGSSL